MRVPLFGCLLEEKPKENVFCFWGIYIYIYINLDHVQKPKSCLTRVRPPASRAASKRRWFQEEEGGGAEHRRGPEVGAAEAPGFGGESRGQRAGGAMAGRAGDLRGAWRALFFLGRWHRSWLTLGWVGRYWHHSGTCGVGAGFFFLHGARSLESRTPEGRTMESAPELQLESRRLKSAHAAMRAHLSNHKRTCSRASLPNHKHTGSRAHT